MTKKNGTKRSLLMSAVALVLCLSMLIGSTFAWFTDSVTNSGNKIQAGTLDVQLLMHDGTDYADISDNTAPIFGAGSIAQDNNAQTLWEPGKTQVAYLAIKNNGNLALKYTVALDVENVSKDLYEVMEYAIVPDAQYDSVSSWPSGNAVVAGTQSVSGAVSLEVGATHYFALAIHMDENAGNEYMNGEVNFDLTVLATQLTNESDSFGPTYDAEAPYPNGTYISAPITNAAATVGNGTFTYASADNLIEVSGVTTSNDVTVTVEPTATTNEVTSITADSGQSVVSYNIDVNGQTNGSDVTVELFIGKGLTNVEVYHNGTKMTSGVDYNPTTGFVTITTNSFSPYEIAFVNPGAVTNAAALATALAKGGEVVLAADVTSDSTLKIPEGVTVNLDLNGKTLSGTTVKQVPVIINNGTLTVKGGTISSTGACGGAAIVNKGTAVVTDVTLNGAKFGGFDGWWPSYAMNNSGDATLTNVTINSYHGAISAYNGANVVLNNVTVDVGQGTTTNQTSWALYAYDNGTITVNSGSYIMTKVEPDVNGGGVLCTDATGAIIVNGGTFIKEGSHNNGGPIYVKDNTLTVYGGTFNADPTAYTKGLVVDNGDGTWTVKPYEVSTAADLADKLANGSPVMLTSDVAFTSKLSITKDAYIDANGKTIKFTSGSSTRFIDVPKESLGADLTIKNAVIDIDGSFCDRGINYNTNGILTLDNVTLTGATKATYGINLPADSSNATVNMTNCNITAHIALNVWGENAVINVTDCNLSNYDDNSTEGEDYNTVKLNNDGTYSAEGTIITITGGTITAKNELGADFAVISNGTATGAIVVSDTTVVNGNTVANVAIIRYKDGNGNFYGEFYDTTSLQAAVTLASKATNAEVFLLTDINVDTLDVPANVTIHTNGHDLTIGATTGSGNLNILD